MLYMVLEKFKDGNAVEVYRRFRDKGRMMPAGVLYIASWVDNDLKQCFQLMEADDENLLSQWTANWDDIVDYEIHPVMSSDEALEKIRPQL